MIFEAVDRAVSVITSNFGTDFAALASAKSLGGLTATVTVYKDVSAATFSMGRDLPGIGIHALRAQTQAKSQGVREGIVTTVFDYLARADSALVAMQQAKVAAEAILKSVDKLWEETGIMDAGGVPLSISVEMDAIPVDAKALQYDGRARVLVPINTRDTVS